MPKPMLAVLLSCMHLRPNTGRGRAMDGGPAGGGKAAAQAAGRGALQTAERVRNAVTSHHGKGVLSKTGKPDMAGQDEAGIGPDAGNAGAEADEGHYATVRVRLLKDARALRRAAEHGARRDESAAEAMRDDANPDRRALGWTFGMKAAEWIGMQIPGGFDRDSYGT